MSYSVRASCTLCGVGFGDGDLDRSIWGICRGKNGIFYQSCRSADMHICVLCVGQLKATQVNHWVLENGLAREMTAEGVA